MLTGLIDEKIHQFGIDVVVLFSHFYLLQQTGLSYHVQILTRGLTGNHHVALHKLNLRIWVIEQVIEQLVLVLFYKQRTKHLLILIHQVGNLLDKNDGIISCFLYALQNEQHPLLPFIRIVVRLIPNGLYELIVRAFVVSDIAT